MSSTGGGRYSLYSQGSSGWSILRYEEFQEEDVWGVLRPRKESNSSSSVYEESSIIASRHLSTAVRVIPKSNSSFIREPKIVQHSAPVNIPDWSRIYGISPKKASNNASWLDDDDHYGSNEGIVNDNWDIDEEEEDDDDGDMVPPHEWIARKLARSQISSFSVCEGVGRTLKGRDLSNVRNAVLTKTGFLE